MAPKPRKPAEAGSSRALLRALAAMATRAVVVGRAVPIDEITAVAADADPVFPLIEAAAKVAESAFLACDPRETGNTPTAIELLESLEHAEGLLYSETPQTSAGTLAYAEYVLRFPARIVALRRELGS